MRLILPIPWTIKPAAGNTVEDTVDRDQYYYYIDIQLRKHLFNKYAAPLL